MIHSTLKGNLKKIFLESDCCSIADFKKLEQLIEPQKNYDYDITFSNLQSIPLGVVLKLLQIENQLIVYTTQRTLWLYLNGLGIKTHLLRNKLIGALPKKNIEAIAIGGSAGSIEKIIQIIRNLAYVDISLFITVHLLPDAKSYLSQIIQNETKYNVSQPLDGTKIEKYNIYIAPPSKHMVIRNGNIYLEDTHVVNFAKPSIDVMFLSISEYFKENSIAILTCGYGSDGSKSLYKLKQNKTEIILEDPSSCEAQDMLINAIQTNQYDKILSIDQIGHYLDLQLYSNLFFEDEINSFLNDLYDSYGYDFRNYEKKSIYRRINITQNSLGIYSFSKFKSLVFSNEEVLEQLVRNFSINVTSFFRNPRVFGDLMDLVAIHFKKKKFLRIWCAGCSSGQEPYSIAILLDKLGMLQNSQIYATDFDASVIVEAINGLYPKSLLESTALEIKEYLPMIDLYEYFDIFDTYILTKDFLKEKILFFQHNLATDGSINEFDLILCRNVIIYFDKELKKRVFSLIKSSMNQDSILVLGESELPTSLQEYQAIGTEKKRKIFKKTPII